MARHVFILPLPEQAWFPKTPRTAALTARKGPGCWGRPAPRIRIQSVWAGQHPPWHWGVWAGDALRPSRPCPAHPGWCLLIPYPHCTPGGRPDRSGLPPAGPGQVGGGACRGEGGTRGAEAGCVRRGLARGAIRAAGRPGPGLLRGPPQVAPRVGRGLGSRATVSRVLPRPERSRWPARGHKSRAPPTATRPPHPCWYTVRELRVLSTGPFLSPGAWSSPRTRPPLPLHCPPAGPGVSSRGPARKAVVCGCGQDLRCGPCGCR